MVDLLTIQQTHRKLYGAFLKKTIDKSSETELRELLKDIVECSRQVLSLEDYDKLFDIVEEWKKAAPAFGIDVSDVLLVPPSPDQVIQHPPDQPIWTENSLRTWVYNKSSELNTAKALAWYNSTPTEQIVREFEANLSPEEAARLADSNWAQAELYLAADILVGGPDLARSLSPASYWRLEGNNGQMWLRDYKTLRAYLNWKARGGGWGDEAARFDYLQACQQIVDSLVDPRRKAPQAAFDSIQRYIQSEFLNENDGVDFDKKKPQLWVEVKARKLMDNGAEHIEQGRQTAKDQMKRFYGNITRAVLGVDEASTLLVLEGLGLHPKYQVNDVIVNCFEMAVAIYFLEASITKRLLGECTQAEMPGLTAMAAAASGR